MHGTLPRRSALRSCGCNERVAQSGRVALHTAVALGLMSLRLGRRYRLAIDSVLVVVLVSGIAWLLLDRDDALDSGLRPWLRTAVRLHALAGLGCVYGVGTLWFIHVRRAWRSHRNRVAGITVFVLMTVLIATGYALGYLTDEGNHRLVARLHWIGGLLAALAYSVHRVRGAATRAVPQGTT